VVAGIGALAGAPWLVVLGLAAEPYYAAVILADSHQVAAGRLGYGLALAVCVAAITTGRRRPVVTPIVPRPVAAVRSRR
jgi:hypothetical protein